MRIAALVLLGFICFLRLPIDLLPKIDIPTINVNVNWPNTGPEEMESQITRPLEQAVSSIRGLDRVISTSSQGNSNVRIQFKYGVDVDKAAIDVMQQVQRAVGRFPKDPNISTPQIFKFDPSTTPILVYGVSSKRDNLVKLRDRMINELSPQIEAAGGVAQVNISGGQLRAVIVDVDPSKLQARGISISQVSRRIQEENISQPAGISIEGRTQYNLRSIGYFRTLEDIRNVPVGTVNGSQITLKEVASVRDANQDITSYTRLNGEPALNVTITKQSDANTVETSKRVQEVIKGIEERNPDIDFNMAYNQATFIEKSIADLNETAIIGGALAILIITFFLRNLRSTFVVALSIPISIFRFYAMQHGFLFMAQR
jgi:HAE1 family hydrophobic/amphiphilic exporter-1